MIRSFLAVLVLSTVVLFLGWRTYSAFLESPYSARCVVSPSGNTSPTSNDGDCSSPSHADVDAAYGTVVQNSVFRPDRRPYVPATQTQSPPPSRDYNHELSVFTVKGVLAFGSSPSALVQSGRSTNMIAEPVEVVPGDSLGGFVVREIRPEGLTVSADNQDFLLPFYGGGPGSLPTTQADTRGNASLPVAPPRNPPPLSVTLPTAQPFSPAGGIPPSPSRPTNPNPIPIVPRRR